MPDNYRIVVREDILTEEDPRPLPPMSGRSSRQAVDPADERSLRPDPGLLAARWQRFRAAGVL